MRSDPVSRPPTLEQQVEIWSQSSTLQASSARRSGGASDLGLSALFAASNPERVSALLLSSVAPRGGTVLNPELRGQFLDAIEHHWGDGTLMKIFASQVLDDVEEFLTGRRPSGQIDRVLATVLFTNIVDSTALASELGDGRWRALLHERDTIIRTELDRLARARGQDDRRRFPRDVRRAGASGPLRRRDRRSGEAAGAERPRGPAHGRVRARR